MMTNTAARMTADRKERLMISVNGCWEGPRSWAGRDEETTGAAVHLATLLRRHCLHLQHCSLFAALSCPRSAPDRPDNKQTAQSEQHRWPCQKC